MTTTKNSVETIKVVNVSKRFERNESRMTLRHEALRILRNLTLRRTQEPVVSPQFWALRDINFSVFKGETLGIIGRNGAGKTTLLRILSNIYRPTTGQVSITGRFATLIALGAGFNPDKSGRENIFLNAAMQGMPPDALKPLLNDIIEFSELGDFIDLPVKRYSTGMTARLGFSIAIHVVPEIIFLDEILAVGDAAFQTKCRARIEEYRDQQHTLVIVSHSIQTVKELCDRTLWLDQGRVKLLGPSDEVAGAYLRAFQTDATDTFVSFTPESH